MRSAGVVVMAQTDAPFRDGGVKSTPPARGPWLTSGAGNRPTPTL